MVVGNLEGHVYTCIFILNVGIEKDFNKNGNYREYTMVVARYNSCCSHIKRLVLDDGYGCFNRYQRGAYSDVTKLHTRPQFRVAMGVCNAVGRVFAPAYCAQETLQNAKRSVNR